MVNRKIFALAMAVVLSVAAAEMPAWASTVTSPKSLAKDLLTASSAKKAGFTKVSGKVSTTSKTGEKSCPNGADEAFESASGQMGVFSEAVAGCPVSHPLRAPSADIRTGHRRLRFPFLLWEAMLRLKGPSVRASKTICVLLNRGRSMAPTVQIGQSEMLATANTPEFGPWIARPEVGGLGQGVSVRGGTGPRLRPEAR